MCSAWRSTSPCVVLVTSRERKSYHRRVGLKGETAADRQSARCAGARVIADTRLLVYGERHHLQHEGEWAESRFNYSTHCTGGAHRDVTP